MDNRTSELIAAAQSLDLIDPDLLQLAKAELPPGDAVRDLQRRFPRAFGSPAPFSPPVPVQPKQFSQMTTAEREDFCHKHRMLIPPRARRGG